MELDLSVSGEGHQVQTDVEVLDSNEARAFVSKPLRNRMQVELHIEIERHVFHLDYEIAFAALIRFVNNLDGRLILVELELIHLLILQGKRDGSQANVVVARGVGHLESVYLLLKNTHDVLFEGLEECFREREGQTGLIIAANAVQDRCQEKCKQKTSIKFWRHHSYPN